MFREIMNDLINWKEKTRRKPLLVTGVRQCGKTYTILEFAKKQFKNYVYINFEETETISAVFDYDFDVNRIISELEHVTKEIITLGETLVFLMRYRSALARLRL